ncbi:hypothetical protein PAHAL_6G230200 [Panicum hallii]|uniref:O-methyltransferase domain-containing protein n=2 Tax=Panicum hallii TaxID=206008 RepID=A0A2S3I3A4_9POAL|nr:hypothetical protein PAHAL_6G230200 [Panicum hallii]
MNTNKNLFQGYVELYHNGLFHVKSMALRCAVELGIPDAIHRRGGAATVSDLVVDTGVHLAKLPCLRRLMRVLTVSGIFAAADHQPAPPSDDESETVYKLTPISRLLVDDDGDDGVSSTPRGMSAMLRLLARPDTAVAPFFGLGAWLRDAGAATLFEAARGAPTWSLTRSDASYNEALNDGCAADSSFAMDAVLNDGAAAGGASSIFRGLGSLVDVGGGHGAAAVAIARAVPHIKCSVLDLEQVVSKAPSDGTVQFIAGDMFQSIPPADAVLLKYVLHCWDDDDCVKILRQCKRAISARDGVGKVIIMNVVVGYGTQDNVVKETQMLFDMFMMRYGGAEREEHEWKKIFLKAGFSDYKITPILGFQSLIEVFP